MIVCLCRGISDKQFATEEELIDRLCQKDVQCGTCLTLCKNFKSNRCKKSGCTNVVDNSAQSLYNYSTK